MTWKGQTNRTLTRHGARKEQDGLFVLYIISLLSGKGIGG